MSKTVQGVFVRLEAARFLGPFTFALRMPVAVCEIGDVVPPTTRDYLVFPHLAWCVNDLEIFTNSNSKNSKNRTASKSREDYGTQ